jgi:hypothetical protein
MSTQGRIPPLRKPNPLPINPSKPLSKPSREIFAQTVAQGIPVAVAYERAGYKGGEVSRSQLRRSADVEARMSWLLAERVRTDTLARHQVDQKIEDARLRLVRELERIAYFNSPRCSASPPTTCPWGSKTPRST